MRHNLIKVLHRADSFGDNPGFPVEHVGTARGTELGLGDADAVFFGEGGSVFDIVVVGGVVEVGSDKTSFVVAAKYIEEVMHPDIIDINMGCPVPKVAVRAQAGAALLKSPDKIYEIVKAVVEAVSVPVTVKIRSGWDDASINAVEVAKICESAGASAICIHGRTRSQGYSGKVNYDIIRQVKEAVNIPVIGNGDITDISSLQKMVDTGVDAFMIGRGVLGNPWLIKQCVTYLESGVILDEPTYIEKIDMCYVKYELKQGCFHITAR